MIEEYDPETWLTSGDISFEADYLTDVEGNKLPLVTMWLEGVDTPTVLFVDEIPDLCSVLQRFAEEAKKQAANAASFDTED
jgi:hypothetical protein